MASRRLPPLPTYRTDAVTRRLCAAMHLDDHFAQQVHEEFTADRMAALGLPLGVNLVAIVRHARVAVKRTETRDRRLAWLFAGWGAALLLAMYGLGSGSSVVAAAGGCGILVVLGTAWWLVHQAESEARAAALAVRDTGSKPGDLAPPAPQEVEDQLRELKRANVMPYTAAAERTNPFVGSGRKIKEAVWQPIDISAPAHAPGGGKLTITPFDAVDLHTYVAREMEKVAGLEGLRAQNRLYVLGTHVQRVGPELLPEPAGRPRARIPTQLVQAGLVHPGAGMRTYLSLERVGEGGRVIVSMYLRARLQHPSLSWEVAAFAIPPVSSRYNRVDYLPLDGFERWWSLVRFATRQTWPALRGALRRNHRRGSERSRKARDLEKWRKEIGKRHAVYDYGAVDSLRERVASWDALGHSDRTDSQDFLHRLQQGVLIATERFLKDHNVDTSSFDKAQQVINTQTYNFSGDITGPSNFGNNGQVTAYGQGPLPSGAPGNAGGQP
ncbi:hypothetical protein BX264_5633 [Streptomyces sp. 2333.5]|nr:hypothetical protein BX264_5633 [Streptomyces sp. 2333.5]SEE69947.1 hypothetical protein SAMN05428943_5735 [Streptomyces sp. 2314.4]SEE95393.1 hypothetical protein SAMN05428942_5731 [Streptomyces sp. 2112.2]SOE10428.1 hypothetical protein SAMN06272775_1472 [Streptomyces sp. 2323.1]